MIRRMIRRILLLITAAIFAIGVSWKMQAQSPGPVFTAAQSDAGRTAYAQNCASCHGDTLDDGQFAAALRTDFRGRWSQKSLDDLFMYISTKMPPNRAGALERKTYAALLAYLLEANGVQPGNRELSSEPDPLRTLTLPKQVTSTQQRLRVSGLGVAPETSLPPWPAAPNLLNKMAPVTDVMLSNPAPGEWLTWRRTYDDMGFSPLKQITKDNVKNLRVAWPLSLPPGPNEATPLVHDGVIFVHSYNDNVQALDAVSGNELWHHARRLPEGTRGSTKRNIALYGTKLWAPSAAATGFPARTIQTRKCFTFLQSQTCMNMTPVEAGARGFLSTGIRNSVIPRPESDGRYGRLQAINLETRTTVWTERQRAPQSTGVLATAGGVVFAGALDRWFTAYNDIDGKVLWKIRLNVVPNSASVTYMVNGKQYLAVVVGYGGVQPSTFAGLIPEISLPVARSSAIWVFELP